jgi:hypothetical protein
MEINLGLEHAPAFFWWFLAFAVLIRFGGAGVSLMVNAYAALFEKRSDREISLANLQANTVKSTPSKRTPWK